MRPRIRLALLIALAGGPGCASTPPPCGAADTTSPVRPGRDAPGPVLFVMTAADRQTLTNGKQRGTGFFLNEFYEAYRAVRGAGFDVVFATVDGRPPVVDPESLREKYWKAHPAWLAEARSFVATSAALARPVTLARALADEASWSGLVVPGGQGVMIDLLASRELAALLLELGATRRPVGLICHAPALLARLPREHNPFRGRALTSVSGAEEFIIETFIMKGRARERGIQRRLELQGYHPSAAFAGRGFAVRDCNLVTSQNPFSGAAFADAYVAALTDWRQGVDCSCSASAGRR